jgi:hypothetical protein
VRTFLMISSSTPVFFARLAPSIAISDRPRKAEQLSDGPRTAILSVMGPTLL